MNLPETPSTVASEFEVYVKNNNINIIQHINVLI